MITRHQLPLDRVNLFTALGIEIVEQSPERVVARMPFGEAVSQLTGHFHGGAIVALADTAATILCLEIAFPDSDWEASAFPTTMQLSVNFVRNASTGTLRAESTPLHAGRSTIVVTTTVSLDSGRLAATVTVPISGRAVCSRPAVPPAEAVGQCGDSGRVASDSGLARGAACAALVSADSESGPSPWGRVHPTRRPHPYPAADTTSSWAIARSSPEVLV